MISTRRIKPEPVKRKGAEKEIITTKIFNPRPEKIDKEKVKKTESLTTEILGHHKQK